jgi:DNA polymerase V
MVMEKVFALVDCNNFYASCEKLFRPDLADAPVVVLSNNDGCVVARSKEAKALGIKMGVPYFQIRELVEKYGVVAFSSNYALYADMSSRVMTTLEQLAPSVEVYSIDEAFVDLTGVASCLDLSEFGQQIRTTIGDWIGIKVCVGIAPSKTLAKLANHAAKKWSKTEGVVDLTDRVRQRKLMALLPVSEVWGIGSRITKRLNDIHIYTALDLADAPAKQIRSQFSVVVERTVSELNGESCLRLEEVADKKKEIVSSRSFSERITQLSQMQEAVSEYVHRACEKLRSQKSHAKQLTVFLRTSPFSDRQTDPYYANSVSGELIYPSSDTRDFLHLANELLLKLWKEGFRYAKSGVMLTDFYDDGIRQQQLFADEAGSKCNPALMAVIDQINQQHSRNTIYFAAKGTQQNWSMKRGLLSPAYTTCWSAIPKV